MLLEGPTVARRMYSDTGGDGPAEVALLHGARMNGTLWNHVVGMRDRYRCTVWELPLDRLGVRWRCPNRALPPIGCGRRWSSGHDCVVFRRIPNFQAQATTESQPMEVSGGCAESLRGTHAGSLQSDGQ